MPHVIDATLRPIHAKVYMAVREAWLEHGIAPSQMELQLACQCSGTTVHQAIRELRKRGYVVAPKFAVRAIKPTDFERTISVKPLDPWAPLDEVTFFRPPDWTQV